MKQVSEEIKPLYSIFFVYIIFAIVSGNIVLNYVSELMIISLLILSIYTSRGIISFLQSYFNFLVLFVCISAIYVMGADIYTLLVLLKAFLLYKYFQISKITIREIVDFLNITYAIYLCYSLIVYFYVVMFTNLEGVNAFQEKIFDFDFVTLFGVEGSTAYIDSYSGLIFVVNILLNRDNSKKHFFSAISLFALLWTTRMTPLVATLGSFVYYFLFPVSLSFVIILFVGIQFGLAIWLKSQPDPVKFFFATITHNRSLMWSQHFEVFLESMNLKQFFFTTYDDKYNVELYGHYGYQNINPHNSYFLLLYNSVIGSMTMFYLFLKKSIFVTDNRLRTLVFFILVAAVTNSKVIGLGNPIYLILITFSMSYSGKSKRLNKKMIVKNID